MLQEKIKKKSLFCKAYFANDSFKDVLLRSTQTWFCKRNAHGVMAKRQVFYGNSYQCVLKNGRLHLQKVCRNLVIVAKMQRKNLLNICYLIVKALSLCHYIVTFLMKCTSRNMQKKYSFSKKYIPINLTLRPHLRYGVALKRE